MLNCSRQSNCFFLYGPVCIYVHSCHIKAAAASGWGECGGALKDILMTTVCEGWASPELPPACPLDYFAISPHALAEFLGDIRASISHTAALTLPPATTPLCFASPLALQISFCSVQVCMCACTHHPPPLFFWKLIRITITGMWFDSRPLPVAWQLEGEVFHGFLKGHTPLYSSRCVKPGKSLCVRCSSEAQCLCRCSWP